MEAFSLTDGMGRSRARRAARAPRGARANVRPKLDLLDGPSRRTGRPSVSASHAASRATRLREAKDLLLQDEMLLDEIGDRAHRAPSAGRRTEFWRSTAARRRGDLSDATATPELAARRFLDDDLLESPGGRVRRGDARRAVRDAARGVHPANRGESADESAGEQRKVLGLLSGPSDRVGRAERAARGDERARRGVGKRGKTYDAGKSAACVLGILSGPGKRLGRERRA